MSANKWTLLNHDEGDDDDQGSSTPIDATASSSCLQSAKGKEKIESHDKYFASKTSRVEDEEEVDITTTAPDVPWSLFANKDSVLVLGDWNDEDSKDVHDDDDDFWPDKSYGNTDSSEDEYADETEIGGTCFSTVPVMRQACVSNQFSEMLGRAAQFGKPYLAHGDQVRPTADTAKGPARGSSSSSSNHPWSGHSRVVSNSGCGIPGASHDRAISGETITHSDSGIPGTSSTSSSSGTTTTANNVHQEMKQVQKIFSGSSRSGEKGSFKR
ncbi:hypothetical protein BGZ79_004515, partial [Entomortierella chlamydospora]